MNCKMLDKAMALMKEWKPSHVSIKCDKFEMTILFKDFWNIGEYMLFVRNLVIRSLKEIEDVYLDLYQYRLNIEGKGQ